MAFHLCSAWARRHLGPLIIIAVGFGFAIVGAIPVAVNFAIGSNNSSTIIGVGFIGFGLLLMVPGMCWCVIQRLVGLKRVCGCCCCCWNGDGSRWADAESVQDCQETTPALENRPSQSNSTGTVEMFPSIAHYDCIFTDEEAEDEAVEAKPDVFIIIPTNHKSSPSR